MLQLYLIDLQTIAHFDRKNNNSSIWIIKWLFSLIINIQGTLNDNLKRREYNLVTRIIVINYQSWAVALSGVIDTKNSIS